MIQAALEGKSQGYEYREDILTSTAFGMIKYLKPESILIPFIESAFLYDKKRTTLWQKLKSEGIELRCYREIEYIFWAWNQKYGEPDLILIFKNHIHGDDDLLLVIEVKFKSGKSGKDDNDQLARYFEAINYDIESFADEAVSGFCGKKGFIVYLTESEAYSDISESTRIISSKYPEIKENVFHLRWHQLYVTLEKMGQFQSSFEKPIVDDLKKYLEKVGLRDFSGISLTEESLDPVFLSPFPAFFMAEKIAEKKKKTVEKKKTYFDQLGDLDIKIEKNIFFGGDY